MGCEFRKFCHLHAMSTMNGFYVTTVLTKDVQRVNASDYEWDDHWVTFLSVTEGVERPDVVIRFNRAHVVTIEPIWE